jgi:CSLREA domain-containing protein
VTVNTLSDVTNLSDNLTTLREAIFATNTVPGADTIEFEPSLTAGGPVKISLTQGELAITDSLTISGRGSGLLTINGSGQSRVFNVTTKLGDVSFVGLTVARGTALSIGGAGLLVTAHNVLFSDLVLSENIALAGNSGGGALVTADSIRIEHSSFVGNQSLSGSGGGLFTLGATTIVSSQFRSNSARLGGGLAGTSAVQLTDSTIEQNSTSGSGGGIWMNGNGSLTVTNSVIRGNKALAGAAGGSGGGIGGEARVTVIGSQIIENESSFNGGGIGVRNQVTIQNSIVSGNNAALNGGGVYASGALSVTNSQISNNSAGTEANAISYGGGIFVSPNTSAAAIIENTTISGNFASRGGGGISARSNVQTLNILSSTISGNTARKSGGIIAANLLLRHSTVTNNSAIEIHGDLGTFGGVAAYTISLDHSIVAGNHEARSGAPDVSGVLKAKFSLIGTIQGNKLPEAPVGSPDSNGNLIGGPVHGPIDPKLGELTDNGGFTLPDGSHIKTHALLPGSPAINAGDLGLVAGVNDVPHYDEREMPYIRVFNGRIDIGAFEYQEPSDLNLVVDTLVDESDGNYAKGDLSLREAIQLANMYTSMDTIRFDPALTASGPVSIVLTMGELNITDDVSIVGLGSELLTLDASGNDPTPGVFDGKGSRIFKIGDETSNLILVTITGLRLVGADGANAIESVENLVLDGISLEQSAGLTAVIQSAGKLRIERSRIANNTVRVSATNSAVVTSRDLVFQTSEVSQNTGTAISALVDKAGTILIADSNVSDNSGKGIVVTKSPGSFQLLRSTISGNTGGLDIWTLGSVLISDSTFARNVGFVTTTVPGAGGAYIRAMPDNTTVTIERSHFIENRAPSGAGLRVAGSAAIRDSEFRGNTAYSGDGGGLLVTSYFTNGPAQHVITGSTFVDNVATRGGGLFTNVSNFGSIVLENNLFSNNTADTQGGGLAISANGGIATVRRTTFHGNHAAVQGGGAWVSSSGSASMRFEDSTFDGNSARNEGGGGATLVASGQSQISVLQSTISGNSSTGAGGGLSITLSGGSVNLTHSTITQNGFGVGGGVFATGGSPLRISNSIIAGNIAQSTSPDFHKLATNVIVSFSLIGNSGVTGLTPAPVGAPDVRGNIIGGTTSATAINPRLATLAENGGPTKTHALLPNSPAINSGDPAAVPGSNGVPTFDQRGNPYIRVFGGRIDIGAFESQPQPVPGDFNYNGMVDAADYVLYRKGSAVADGNGSGQVTDEDLAVWRAHFGESRLAAAGATSISADAASSVVDDAAAAPVVRRTAPKFVAAAPWDAVSQPAGRTKSTPPFESPAAQLLRDMNGLLALSFERAERSSVHAHDAPNSDWPSAASRSYSHDTIRDAHDEVFTGLSLAVSLMRNR